MMMETAVYSPEFLLAQEMHQRGEFGRIQFLRGYWYNNLENHPRYWHGLPPMHYVTHPLGPILALAGTRAASVVCLGSGAMRKELQEVYRNPWPIETAIFRLAGTPAVAEVTSITVETALSYKETFDLYGDRMTLESARLRDEKHALIRIHSPGQARYSPMTVMRVDIPSFNGRLPEPLREFGPNAPQPHLVHEFVRSIVEGRKPWIDAATAANWTAPGICAHQSALQGGAIVEIPSFG
jgi:predicted dehydrogenase